MKIDEELVEIDLEADSKEEVLKALGYRLAKKGSVKEGYITSVLQREESFPTGLPTEPFGVAIPHTDGDLVNESEVAFALLKNPVKFSAMGSGDQLIDVKMVFMLALKTPESQLDMLQKLVSLFQNAETVRQLAKVKDADQLNALIQERAEN